MGCIGTEEDRKKVKLIHDSIDTWFNNDALKIATKGDTRFFKELFYKVTGEDFDFGNLPSEKKLKLLDKKIKKQATKAVKSPGKFTKFFWLTEDVLDNPLTANTFNDMYIAHNYFRGSVDSYMSDLKSIVGHLRDASGIVTEMEGGKLSFNKARKNLAKKYAQYAEAMKDNRKEDALETITEIEKMLTQSEYKVFAMADDLFRNPNRVADKKISANYLPPIVEAARLWGAMSKKLYGDMMNGLNQYIDMLDSASTTVYDFTSLATSMRKLRDTVKEKKNYLPIQVLDVFPAFTHLNSEMFKGGDWSAQRVRDLNSHVNNIVKDFAESVALTSHTKESEAFSTKRYSKDLPSVLDAYVKNITRFNFASKVNNQFIKSVQKLSDLQGTELENHSRFLIDYMYSVHGHMLGQPNSHRAQKVARWITSWQFMSKLGLNLRGAVRNATQSVQNLVYFGVTGTTKSLSYLKGNDMNETVIKEMKRHGIFFAEPRELTQPFGMMPEVEIRNVNGHDVPVYKDNIFGSDWTQKVEAVAKASGLPMQVVENYINRNLTFKIAFAQMHRKLSQNRAFVERWTKARMPEGMTSEERGKFVQEKASEEIIKRSSRFAANMVRELHYEYAGFAKPHALRTPAGAVMGQFATYSINFFNYQRKILQDAGNELMLGYWGEGAWRASRLASVYFMTNALLSPMFSVDIGNLMQHDTFERLQNITAAMSSNPEERKKAFWGKGPIVGTVGGPFISDMITLGNIIGLYELDESGWLSMLAGYQDYADATDSSKGYDLVRTINTQIGRAAYITAPRMYNGATLGTLIQTELGLFKTKGVREKRESMYTNILKPAGLPMPTDIQPTKKPVSKKSKAKQASILKSLGSLEQISGGIRLR